MSQLTCTNRESVCLTNLKFIRHFSTGNDAHDVCISSELTIDLRLSVHSLHARTNAQGSDFKDESVAGHNGSAKTSFFDSGKEHKLLISIFNLSQGQHRSNLGQRFNNQNTRHYWSAGKVALEKRFVDAYLLDTNDALTRY